MPRYFTWLPKYNNRLSSVIEGRLYTHFVVNITAYSYQNQPIKKDN